MTPEHPQILIVYPYSNIATNPTMVALVEELAGRGAEVCLMTQGPVSLAVWETAAGRIRSLALDPSFWDRKNVGAGLTSFLRAWKSGKLMDPFLKNVLDSSRCDVVVGVDPQGICIAANINRIRPRPMAYVSFELLFEDEVESEYECKLKARERTAAERCRLFLLQDEKRRDLFCKENNVDVDDCELVPVSPVDAHPPRTNYLRERLGIDDDKTIVLYQGSVYDWSCRHEFEELVSYWPDRFCLVVHSRDRSRKRMAKYMKQVSAGRSIHFTTEPVSPSELPLLTASADIGLASYRTSPDSWYSGDNLRFLGLSSGKIAYYAMSGLPVLARYLPTTSEVLEQYGFGLSYRRPADSTPLLERIVDARDTMSKAARAFYELHLNPAEPIRRFCDRLLALGQSRV